MCSTNLVGPLRLLHCELLRVLFHEEIKQLEAFEKCWAHSPQRAASRQFTRCRHCTVARRLRIDVHNDNDDDDDDNDNA